MSALDRATKLNDSVSALRFLAMVIGQGYETEPSDEENYGLEVILKQIADNVQACVKVDKKAAS